MIKEHSKKRRKFAHEILGIIALCGLISLLLFLLLVNITSTAVEIYCIDYDVPMTEFDWIAVDRLIFGAGAVIAILCFSILFLALLSNRLSYIRKLTEGIHRLHPQHSGAPIPLEGNNELTELAEAINQMSAAQMQLRKKEQALALEKEQLIRTLSHDIRTPLTSVLSYSEYLATEPELSREEQQAHLQTIRKKAEQIRDLTDILLDGKAGNEEFFEDARLLLVQLAQEFEEALEDRFSVRTDFSRCIPFRGHFDVQQLRRVFDNLSSNVAKYADPAEPVFLFVSIQDGVLVIRQANTVLVSDDPATGHGLGISSIRRIAQHYGGRVSTRKTQTQFAITVEFSNY